MKIYILCPNIDDCYDDEINAAFNDMYELAIADFDDTKLLHVPDDHPALLRIRDRLPHEHMMLDQRHS